MDKHRPRSLGHLAGRWLTGLILLCAVAWQSYLGIHVGQLRGALEKLGETPNNLVVFIVWTQPLMWVFVVVTLVLAIDVLRRREFLLLSSVASLLAVILGTAFLQVLVVLSGYAPIFDLGKAS
jgi:hypothetical protein